MYAEQASKRTNAYLFFLIQRKLPIQQKSSTVKQKLMLVCVYLLTHVRTKFELMYLLPKRLNDPCLDVPATECMLPTYAHIKNAWIYKWTLYERIHVLLSCTYLQAIFTKLFYRNSSFTILLNGTNVPFDWITSHPNFVLLPLQKKFNILEIVRLQDSDVTEFDLATC